MIENVTIDILKMPAVSNGHTLAPHAPDSPDGREAVHFHVVRTLSLRDAHVMPGIVIGHASQRMHMNGINAQCLQLDGSLLKF